MIDKATNFSIKIFPSISEASRELNISVQAIFHVVKGKGYTAGGYKWRYV